MQTSCSLSRNNVGVLILQQDQKLIQNEKNKIEIRKRKERTKMNTNKMRWGWNDMKNVGAYTKSI